MTDPPDELIPPDDPRFEGAQFLNDDALLAYRLERSAELFEGTRWRWSKWRERPAVLHDPKTGEEEPDVWDHDHCELCHAGFSERYEGDLREGWTASGPAGCLWMSSSRTTTGSAPTASSDSENGSTGPLRPNSQWDARSEISSLESP